MRRVALAALFGALSVTAPAVSHAGPIDNLQPGQWYEVPNSRLDAALPNPEPPGGTGPSAIVDAWSGGAYDTMRDRLLVWGGGHGDYGGNEVYAFDINALTWSRIWGPTNVSLIPWPPPSPCVNTYADGNPVSRHTYDGLVYLPEQDAFWINGGSRYCGSGGFGIDTWELDLADLRWQRKADRTYGGPAALLTDYDPTSHHVLVQAYNTFLEYDPLTDRWSRRGVYDPGLGNHRGAAYDFKRKKFVIVGGGEVSLYDLNQAGIVSLQKIATTGDTGICSAAFPGVVYDPVADRIVAWNGGADVYTLDLDSRVWTRHATTGAVIPTAQSGTGTHGRFQYIPSKNAYVAVNQIYEDVYFYKLSPGGVLPDSIPPSPPGSLRSQ